jgi:excisionase family DNA binding protein
MTNYTRGETAEEGSTEPSRLLTPGELAKMLSVPVSTLYAWRYHGKGPVAVRVGRHLRYRRDEVDAWIAHSERDQNRRR